MTNNNNDEEILKHFGGMSLNSLRNILLDITDVEQTIETISHSPYIDTTILGGYMKKFATHFTILSLNIQCLNAKFEALSLFIKDLNDNGFHFSAICLQETWLQNNDSMLYKIPGYKSIALNASCSSHGGLMIFVADEFQFTKLNLYECSPIWEGLFLDIFDSCENKYTLCNIYRPPRDSNDVLQSFINILAEKFDSLSNCPNLIITGDFNIDLLSLNNREKYSDYFNQMINNSMMAQISLPTRFSRHRATLIDHIFSRSSTSHKCSQSGIILTQISDHLPVFACLERRTTRVKQSKYIKIQTNNSQAINSFCSEINQTSFVDKFDRNPHSDPSDNYERLLTDINLALDKHLPIRTVRFNRYKHKIAPWATLGILKSVKYKDKLYKKLKQTKPTSEHFESLNINFRTYSRILKRTISLAKKDYYHTQLTLHRKDSRKTWDTIRSLLSANKSKSEFPNFFMVNDTKITDDTIIANNFNKFFTNIGKKLAAKINTSNLPAHTEYLTQQVPFTFSFREVNPNDITKIIDKFKSKSSVGFDNISMKLIKKVAVHLSLPLSVIINQSLNTGIFPDKLKIAKVLPLYKKECNTIFDNYRPISLLPCIYKIFERVAYNQLYDYFDSHRLFYHSQHGFRTKHSTETATLEFIDKIMRHLDNGELPIAIYIDLSKAFDTIDHTILLSKLNFYGVKDNSLNWFSSYLSNRKQFVAFKDSTSDLHANDIGVPQGSILGPLLFIIYVNDLCQVTQNFTPILYADDTTLEAPLCSFNYLQNAHNFSTSQLINSELINISKWLSVNKLSMNTVKTKYMIFHLPQRHISKIPELNISINNVPLEKVSEFNFLGITIDETLSWKPHITKVCNKIARSIGVIKKLNKFLPESTLVTLYNSLILPHILYGILVWGHTNNRIYKLQKRAVRSLTNSKYNAHTSPLFKKLKLLTVQDIFKTQCLKFFYKYKNELLPRYFHNIFTGHILNHAHNTRNRDTERQILPNKSSCAKCLRYIVPVFVGSASELVLDKIHTHSLKGFAHYCKITYLNMYKSECTKENCYICGRQ